MPLLNKRLLQDNVTKHKHEIASDKKQALKELSFDYFELKNYKELPVQLL